MAAQDNFDFIVAGGGNAGCVLASRLSQALPSMTVALVEAGPDAHDNPSVTSPLGCAALHNTELEWNYMTVPQRSLAGRTIYNCAGKLLSGSSAVNYGGWVRGHAADFDHWADLVGDARWSYKSLLPFFKRVESHFQPPAETPDAAEHGFDGPMHTMPPEKYKISNTIRDAFVEAGIKHVADANSGHPEGIAAWTQNWHNGVRQAAGQVYDLSKVTVLTNTLIRRVIMDTASGKPRATGVEITSGRQLHARKEVIVSCGALRTPQLLMLSGIGESQQLKSLGIAQSLDSPHVGQNLHDHSSIVQYFKLKHPEKGLALGSEAFAMPIAGPADWVVTASAATDRLSQALQKDGIDARGHAHIASPRMHYETVMVYAPIGVPPELGEDGPPFDGTIIAAGSICLLPTSRGSVTLISADPAADPVIDPNYLSTEHDLEILRTAMRGTIKAMNTPAAKAEIEGEWHPKACSISPDSTDADFDARIKPYSGTWYHPAGTASMGKVVDTECRVIGAENLRVLDASILPAPIAAHLQATIYAMSEQLAHMMASAYGASV